jgi:hypothetical protein
MPDNTRNGASSRRTKITLAVLGGFIVTLGGVVSAFDSIVTDFRSAACAIGLPFSWCKPPDVPVPDTWSVEVGGSGGDPFNRITCRPDQVLVGLYGKANIGPFIYSIAPICAAVLYNQRHQIASLSADLSKGDEVGSGQGDPFELKCPSNMLVIGSEWDSAIVNTNFGAHDYLVAPLRLRCASVLSSADASPIKTISEAGERQASASAKPFSCRDGSAAFGIGGRAGQFIDALSLGCRAYK